MTGWRTAVNRSATNEQPIQTGRCARTARYGWPGRLGEGRLFGLPLNIFFFFWPRNTWLARTDARRAALRSRALEEGRRVVDVLGRLLKGSWLHEVGQIRLQ